MVHRMRTMEAANPELSWGDMAVLIAPMPSRAIEESLVRWGILTSLWEDSASTTARSKTFWPICGC